MSTEKQSTNITEDNQQHLTWFLIDRVLAGISGRDGEDLVDAPPLRRLFAGVLQPPRKAEIKAAESGFSIGDAPAGTALGLDFRVLPEDAEQPVRLRITPHWSLYYVVFPTWQQASRANEGLLAPPPEPQPVIPTPDPYVTTSDADAPESDAMSPIEAVADQPDEPVNEEVALKSGRVILPRVFRRHEIRPSTLSAEIPDASSMTLSLGAVDLASAITQARSAMEGDPDAWRHLGEPEDRERELGNASLLASSASYAQALGTVKGARASLPEWSVVLQVESGPDPAEPKAIRIRVLVANATQESSGAVADPGLEERSLFDAGVAIEIEGGTLLPFEFLLAPKDYRSKPELPAKGINCTAVWDPAVPNRLESETLPIFRQPLYRTNDALEVPFEILDTLDAHREMTRLAGEMDKYLQRWDGFLSKEAPHEFKDTEINACKNDRDEFAREIERFRLGIETLRRTPKLAEAFRLMNRVFGRVAKRTGGRVRAWRLFQIGFIVSQLPSIAVRELSDGPDDDYARSLKSALREVGVLWFPTGGGKTEAYLGLIAIALLFDRLRGKTRGICAWMRFPLRMLSLQQLERLARVIAALNELRSEVPSIQVGDPFAIGYYVGEGVTPNSLSDDDMRRYEQSKDLREEVRLLRKCPFCGSRVEIEPQRATWRLAHVCTNANCFSNTSESLGFYKKSLPICIVDNEIYRFLPSVLVGTVDKLAIVGRSRAFAHIVRGVSQQCPVHGYTSYDECLEHWIGCKAGKKNLIKLEPIKDPGPSILIQDELHLLRAELGVFSGHYEGLLRYLGERAYLPPKILAATATIEAYDTHAFHIYLSRARRYPQPAWEQGESFYATSKPLRHRRIFAGIFCHSRAIEDPALQVLALYQREVRRLQANPRRAAMVMKCPDATDDAVLNILRLHELSLCYVNRKATGGSLIEKLERADRLLAAEGLGTLQSRLLTGDQTIEDVGATLDRIEFERGETGTPRLSVVVATNLISHGVDLERINMMVVCGMPSHYAEYVQSTSRAARLHPGAIFVCFKARDPRETSQYEFFPAMHAHMDRLIEAIAVNRFASFAPNKTVPGLLAGVLLCALTPDLFGSKITKPLDHIPTLQVALGLKPASVSGTHANCVDVVTLQAAIEQIIGVDTVHPPALPTQVAIVRKRVQEVLADSVGDIGRTLETQLKEVLNPLTSFRDVDEGIDFGSIDSASLVSRLRAR